MHASHAPPLLLLPPITVQSAPTHCSPSAPGVALPLGSGAHGEDGPRPYGS